MIIKEKFEISNRKEIKKLIEEIAFENHPLVQKGFSTYNRFIDYQSYKVFDDIVLNFLKLAGENYNILEFWINVYQKNGYVKKHNHITTREKLKNVEMKAGVYYFQKPENSGNIIVSDKLIEVNEEDMIVFNANEDHCTEKNMSDNDRIIFSVNMGKGIKKYWNNNIKDYDFEFVE